MGNLWCGCQRADSCLHCLPLRPPVCLSTTTGRIIDKVKDPPESNALDRVWKVFGVLGFFQPSSARRTKAQIVRSSARGRLAHQQGRRRVRLEPVRRGFEALARDRFSLRMVHRCAAPICGGACDARACSVRTVPPLWHRLSRAILSGLVTRRRAPLAPGVGTSRTAGGLEQRRRHRRLAAPPPKLIQARTGQYRFATER